MQRPSPQAVEIGVPATGGQKSAPVLPNSVGPLSFSSTCWPKSAQWAIAVLSAGVMILLGLHAFASLRAGTRPSEHIDIGGPIYRIDLNRAGPAELGQIEGIGPKLAQRIVEHRRIHGPFRTV